MNVFDLPDTEAWHDREPASLDIVDKMAAGRVISVFDTEDSI